MSIYSTATDKKWQEKWEKSKLYKFDSSKFDKKLYCLEMFSYPSGAKLHLGHWFNYGPTDSWARMKRLQGYNVFQPMGFDAFGLPAENYAIKTGIHPQDSTLKNIDTMEKQLKSMGAMFNWENEIKTCLPDYYKWTQWVFLKLYHAGLAYKKVAPVNWCPSCNTVLANEQVVDGECERCGTEVTKKNLNQWFLKITDYAEELLQKLDDLDWPERTKAMQRHWIGKSTGAEVTFNLEGSDKSFNVFTTRVDTLFGVTYVVLAPENPLVDEITTPEFKEAVKSYQNSAKKTSEIERQSTTREKTGVFTGAFAINPATGDKVPVWVADYVLATYGTGCVMAVPAHDERDFAFATKYSLPIKRVITSKDSNANSELPFVEYGKLVNSSEFDGLTTEEAKKAIVEKLSKDNKGSEKINYRLRDWLVSRQRYWGAPIPIVYCPDCGEVEVPESDLPVRLPYNVDFAPDGKSPLAKCDEFLHTTCPKCGKPATREVDTLDTFVCSSWYYLRYPDNNNDKEAFSPEFINKMLPVDKYVGGPEHACMHLLYARFITKALRDLGYLNFDEPFKSLVHQGIILGPDGNRMSKSKGNVVSPDEYVEKYGSDVFRLYLMFGFAYTEGGAWNDDGIKAMSRFIERIDRLVEKSIEYRKSDKNSVISSAEKELNFVRHNTIKAVTQDAEKFQFNTAIARMMELVNAFYKYDADAENVNPTLFEDTVKDLLILLAPFAPHFTEEEWEALGYEYSIFNQSWPVWDEKLLVKDSIEMGVQVNGKVKTRIEVPANTSKEEIEKAALEDEKVKKFIDGKTVRKVIIIKNSVINIVVG